jgi:hypothetical protein
MQNNINRSVDNSALVAKLINSGTTDNTTPSESTVQKKKGGRPKLDNKRSFEYRVRLTQAESDELLFRAQVLETTPSDILRSFLTFKMPELPKNTVIQKEQYLELSKLATNINQIAHALNVALKAGDMPKLNKSAIDELKRLIILIRSIQGEIVGGIA